MPHIQTPSLTKSKKERKQKVNLISLNLIDALIFTINILSINIAADSPDISYNPNSSQFYTVSIGGVGVWQTDLGEICTYYQPLLKQSELRRANLS